MLIGSTANHRIRGVGTFLGYESAPVLSRFAWTRNALERLVTTICMPAQADDSVGLPKTSPHSLKIKEHDEL